MSRSNFPKLWLAGAVSSLGDGAMLSAGPLLVASRTDDPALVAGAAFASQLPWLLFSLVAGAYVDRLDRRRLVVGVNLVRGAAVGGLAAAIVADVASIPVIYAAVFVLGSGEVLADTAAVALLPAVVAPERLPAANARVHAASIVGNQLAGPPLGAWLFVAAASLPFAFDAATFGAAALFVAAVRMAGPTRSPVGTFRLRHEIAEGVRWLWHHQALRMLAVCLCVMNVTFSAAFATFVLYVRERIGLGPVGFGALLTVSAVGGLAGSAIVSRLEARFGATFLLRAGLVVEASTHVALALIRTPWMAAVVLAVFGVHAMVWGVITVSLRQRIVPERLLGRVNGVYNLFGMGGNAAGAIVGGLIARAFGLTAPFWLAAIGVGLLAGAVWRVLSSLEPQPADGR